MTKESYNKILINENELLPLKNKMINFTDKLDNIRRQKIETDCEKIKNAFSKVINNELTMYTPKLKNKRYVESGLFDLEIVTNLLSFEQKCGYNIESIKKDLSNAIGVRVSIELQPISVALLTCKYNLVIHL